MLISYIRNLSTLINPVFHRSGFFMLRPKLRLKLLPKHMLRFRAEASVKSLSLGILPKLRYSTVA